MLFAPKNHGADMRTTIDIPDHLNPILRSVARDRGTSLSQVVGDILKQALGEKTIADEPVFGFSSSGFPTIKRGSATFTSEDVRALEDEI